MTVSTDLCDLLLGCYTDDHGDGAGISRANALPDGTLAEPRLVATASSPSFVATHPTLPAAYAVAEFEQTLTAFTVDEDGALTPLGDAWPAGVAVCHVAVDPQGRFAVVACWGDGHVIAYDLDENTGGITARHEAPSATDPHTPEEVAAAPKPPAPRQSRAHASLFLSDGRVMTTDLGFDLARVWRRRPSGELELDHEVTLPAGSGPRHLALHPAGHVYIVTEYSTEVFVLSPDATVSDAAGSGSLGRFALAEVVPVFADGAHAGDAGAHISLDEAAAHVHVTVRGSNRIAVLDVLDGGARLRPAADVPCGGDWPRHHLQRGGVIHVTNQKSSDVTTWALEEATGIPHRLLQTLPTGTPTCLAPLGV